MDEKQLEELKRRVRSQEKNVHVHIPYSERTGKLPDFEVRYEFEIEPELGLIKPKQGMRCDFLYEGDDPKIHGIHMIWPEFLDAGGNVLLNKDLELPKLGKATMWVGIPKMKDKIHQNRLQVGTKGYWVVGSKRLAKVEVTKIIGLFTN